MSLESIHQAMTRQRTAILACLRTLLDPDRLSSSRDRTIGELDAVGSMLRGLIDVEEQIVFARFEEVTGLREVGPTWLLRREHRQIEERLRGLLADAEWVGRGDWLTRLGAFEALVSDHLEREQQVFGEVCDGFLDEKAREATRRILGPPGDRSECLGPGMEP